VRLLKMPEEIRNQYDTSSLKVVVHAAAPCPREIKQQMIDWLGDVIYEYYGGSESNGVTALDSEQWRQHPGSVGRVVLGQVHICDEQGVELPSNQQGTVYFSGLPDFEYYKDPVKTREAYNDKGWSTLGDIGYLDDDAYLYLTDRRAFMIVSGGVNIYPQEIENLLVNHPQIMDVAVLGMPNPDFGEEVVAVIEPTKPAPGEEPLSADSLTAAISAYCKANLAAFKCPKRIILMENLPRLPNGKLLKRIIKEQLLQNQ
jgi:acyl-CoA synthetase (AMP-forming)/AMP-acid ligase II